MRRHVLSILALVAFVVLAFGSTDTQQRSSTSQSPAYSPAPPPSQEDAARQNVQLVKYDWYKGGFDTVMFADLTIKNNNDFDIKDITVTCTGAGNSGTTIDTNSKTIYEIIKSHKRRTFRKVSMGFIHSQATRSRCEVTGAVPMR